MTDRQAVAAAAVLIQTYRTRWDTRAIEPVINDLLAKGRTLPDIIAASINAAQDPTIRQPAVIAYDGPHWRTSQSPAGTAARFAEPNCYVCGRKRLDCQKRQDWEISHGIPDPHVFETEEQATANRAVRTDTQRADMTARIRTLFRRVNDELAAPLPPGRQPYLPPDLLVESQARLALDEARPETNQPEQETNA